MLGAARTQLTMRTAQINRSEADPVSMTVLAASCAGKADHCDQRERSRAQEHQRAGTLRATLSETTSTNSHIDSPPRTDC